jgi:hypothetical protein
MEGGREIKGERVEGGKVRRREGKREGWREGEIEGERVRWRQKGQGRD